MATSRELVITAELILSLNPCEAWSEEKIRERVGDGVSLKGLAEAEDVNLDDRLWLVQELQDKGYLVTGIPKTTDKTTTSERVQWLETLKTATFNRNPTKRAKVATAVEPDLSDLMSSKGWDTETLSNLTGISEDKIKDKDFDAQDLKILCAAFGVRQIARLQGRK